MDLPTLADVAHALEARAKHGQTAAVLLQLSTVERRVEASSSSLDDRDSRRAALDQVLRDLISNIDPSPLGGRSTPQDRRLFLAIFARLAGIHELMQERPFLTPQSRSILTSTTDLIEHVEGLHPDDPWEDRREVASKVLRKASRGAVDDYCRLAPLLLAGELVRYEAEQNVLRRLVSPHLEVVATQLDRGGVLDAFVQTPEVVRAVRQLEDRLGEPLHGFSRAGAFQFVISQLQTTYHSIRGISGISDDDVGSNTHYREEQLRLLRERGISIERVFLYEEAERDAVSNIVNTQRALGQGVVADMRESWEQQRARVGSYEVHALPLERAQGILPSDDPAWQSFAVFDYDTPTARVLRLTVADSGIEISASLQKQDVLNAMKYFRDIFDLASGRSNLVP